MNRTRQNMDKYLSKTIILHNCTSSFGVIHYHKLPKVISMYNIMFSGPLSNMDEVLNRGDILLSDPTGLQAYRALK